MEDKTNSNLSRIPIHKRVVIYVFSVVAALDNRRYVELRREHMDDSTGCFDLHFNVFASVVLPATLESLTTYGDSL